MLQLIGAGLATAGAVSTTASATEAEGTTIYIAGGHSADQNGAIHAISPSGEQTWVWTPPENDDPFGPSRYIATPPTVVGGTVYAMTGGGALYGVDAATGETALEVDVPGAGTPTVVDGMLYATGDETAYAVDLAAETVDWENDDAQWIGDPLVVDGSAYVFQETYSDPGIISCLDAANGEVQWEYEREEWEEYIGRTYLDGTLYVGAYQGAFDPAGLHAIDVENGENGWVQEFGEGRSHSAPVVYEGLITVADGDTVFGIDAESGDEYWSAPVAESLSEVAPRTYPPTIVDGHVYVTTDLALVCLDGSSGDELWRYEEVTEEEMLADAATVHDGVAYVTTTETQNTRPDQATLHAVDAETGEELWTFAPDPANLIDANQYPMLDGVPTVVDDPAGGDSADSRVLQAIYGHTDARTSEDPAGAGSGSGSEESPDDTGGDGSEDDPDETGGNGGSEESPDDAAEGSDSDGDDGSPGPGIAGALAAIGGATYVLKRLSGTGDGRDDQL